MRLKRSRLALASLRCLVALYMQYAGFGICPAAMGTADMICLAKSQAAGVTAHRSSPVESGS